MSGVDKRREQNLMRRETYLSDGRRFPGTGATSVLWPAFHYKLQFLLNIYHCLLYNLQLSYHDSWFGLNFWSGPDPELIRLIRPKLQVRPWSGTKLGVDAC